MKHFNSFRDYFDRFYQLHSTARTQKDTYNLLEIEYVDRYGGKRYKNYTSFRQGKVKYDKLRGN